jgi:ribonuclease-3
MADYNDFASLADRLTACEVEVLHYQFQDRGQLEKALTHASVAKTRLESNERLEFLGDAILGALICEMLYHRFPEYPEGELTRVKPIRSAIVPPSPRSWGSRAFCCWEKGSR